mmetsp:Transcript_53584/g.125437  ORF Transcript_53584/g.125437 Transcript_53584/m.125437 type:complete len:206 (-) Transcript_53584:1416-2033(-)
MCPVPMDPSGNRVGPQASLFAAVPVVAVSPSPLCPVQSLPSAVAASVHVTVGLVAVYLSSLWPVQGLPWAAAASDHVAGLVVSLSPLPLVQGLPWAEPASVQEAVKGLAAVFRQEAAVASMKQNVAASVAALVAALPLQLERLPLAATVLGARVVAAFAATFLEPLQPAQNSPWAEAALVAEAVAACLAISPLPLQPLLDFASEC